MSENEPRYAPGRVRDAILQVLTLTSEALSVKQIEDRVNKVMGLTPASSIRSYLLLNTPALFVREDRGIYRVRSEYSGGMQREISILSNWAQPFAIGNATLFHADCFDWIEKQEDNSIHAVVTDPPYGLLEYAPDQQLKLRNGKGGVWRIPPAFDGHVRSPLPRFTTLTDEQREQLRTFFFIWARLLLPKLVPGANVVVASNPLLSYILSGALADAGLERRGEIIRLVMTMRGGDRPKAAHEEFEDVSVMPRSMWEPWVIFRKPIEGRVQDNLRKWKTGGFRRQSPDKPFGDVIPSAPTRKNERALAPHPSLSLRHSCVGWCAVFCPLVREQYWTLSQAPVRRWLLPRRSGIEVSALKRIDVTLNWRPRPSRNSLGFDLRDWVNSCISSSRATS